MKRKVIFTIFCFIFSLGLLAHAELLLTRDQVILTEHGMFYVENGNVNPCENLTYLGNGIYSAEVYGHCGRCGWPVDQNGKCLNRNCHQYGPKQD